MSHEILSMKLCQLDERLAKLHNRVHISQTADHNQLQQQIEAMQREYAAYEATLRENLWRSKAGLVSVLNRGYRQIEQIIQDTQAQIQTIETDSPETIVEQKILLAEYALDFAYQAADRALLLSMDAMDAMDAQRQTEERRIP